jgi:hypothetical protein
LGKVKAGAVLKVQLASTDPALTVTALTPDQQPLVETTDYGQWRWVAQASTPGTFYVSVEVTALRGGSEDPLTPTEIFDVALKVQDTNGNRAAQVGSGLKTSIEWGLAQVGGLVGIIAALAGAGYLVSSRRNRGKANITGRSRRSRRSGNRAGRG